MLLLASAVCLSAQATVSLELLGDLNVPSGVAFSSIDQAGASASGQELSREERKSSGGFGGLSGLAFDADTGLLYALSDSSKPTVFVLSLEVDGSELRWSPRDILRLADRSGAELALWTLDPEGLALTANGHLLVASEGYVRREPSVDPGVFQFDRHGRLTADLEVPVHLLPRTSGERALGVRSNEGFEGLSLSPDGEALYVATEGPLAQEDDGCRDQPGCEVRVLEYARKGESFEPASEYVYRLEPAEAPDDFGDARRAMGLSEILAMDRRRLLLLERGYALAEDGRVHQVIRVFEATVPFRPTPGRAWLEKSLVLDLSSIVGEFGEGYQKLDNYEGMCFGPVLEDGSQTVLMISDDNYSERQRTSLLAFRLVE